MSEEQPGSKEYNVLETPIPEQLEQHARRVGEAFVLEADGWTHLTEYTNRVIQRERARFIRMLKQEHDYQDRHGTRLAEKEATSDEEKKAALWNCAYTHAELIHQLEGLE